MRAFGIFAAFAAITSVFAAPVPAPANAVKARDDNAVVSVDLSNAISNLHDTVVNNISPQLQNILDTTSDAQDVANQVIPILTQLAGDIFSTTATIGGVAIENAFDLGDGNGTVTIQEITQMLSDIQSFISANLCNIVAIVNDIDPSLGPTVSSVLNALVWLLQGAQTVLGDLNMTPLSGLLGSILQDLGISIPFLN